MNLNEDAFQACTRAKQLHSGSPVILYGSYARGDANAESDIDVLLVGSGQYRRWNEGKVSFSYYPRPLLSFLFESGSLFALHLQKDGIVFDDPSGEYQGVASRFLAQDDYLHLMVDLVTLANALDVTQLQYNQAPAWLNRIALYLMRTLVFAELAAAGEPCFSIPQIASKTGDKDLVRNYQLKYQTEVSFKDFVRLRSYVEERFNLKACNPFESLTAFIVHEASRSDLVRAFGKKLVPLLDRSDVATLMADYALRCMPRSGKIAR